MLLHKKHNTGREVFTRISSCCWGPSSLHPCSSSFPTIHKWPSWWFICKIAIYPDNTTLYSKCNQESGLLQQVELASESEFESDLWDTGLGLSFSSKLAWGSCIISTLESTSKKTGALICGIKFFSPEVALYLYKCTIQFCMECCCHVWAGAPSCYLELLDKL